MCINKLHLLLFTQDFTLEFHFTDNEYFTNKVSTSLNILLALVLG